MTAADDLSPLARHALWVSCMAANVPVPLSNARTVERVSDLIRSGNAEPRPMKVDDSGRGPVSGGTSSNPESQLRGGLT